MKCYACGEDYIANSDEMHELKQRIAELEDREKHLLQVVYNVAKYSFTEGRNYTGCRNIEDMAVEFATKVQKEHLGGDA